MTPPRTGKDPERPAGPELLAPAGSPDAAFAAFRYGADAVYLGLPRFSARAEADNFTWEHLSEVVDFAHAQKPRRNVYVAFNTLILARELRDAFASLQRLAELGVDAVIMQDLGLARLARLHLPELRLHASTQLAAHSVDGVKALAKLGFRRVVLARELGIGEIGQIVAGGGLEIEAFIHGALCYSYSGLCLFSSHATGRSGNRGRCTYSCRENFKAGGDNAMPFSMKDLALGDRLQALRRAGAAALKIEGRMKSPLYVSAVTDYYRKMTDGTMDERAQRAAEEDIRTIFSRPWTHLYADGTEDDRGVIDPDNVGHRGARIGQVIRLARQNGVDSLVFRSSRGLEVHDGLQIDLPNQARPYGFPVDELKRAGVKQGSIMTPAGAEVEVVLPKDHPFIPVGAPVYCSSSQKVKRSFAFDRPRPGVHRVRHPLSIHATLGAAALELEAETDIPGLGPVGAQVRLDGEFMPARSAEGTVPAARRAFERLGDTDWVLKRITVDDPDTLYVPASMWNEARRRLAEALDAAREELRRTRADAVLGAPAVEAAPSTATEQWSVRLNAMPSGDGAAWAGADEIVVPVSAVAADVPPRIRAAIPLIIRNETSAELGAQVKHGLDLGIRRWEVASITGLELLRRTAEQAGVDRAALDITTDW